MDQAGCSLCSIGYLMSGTPPDHRSPMWELGRRHRRHHGRPCPSASSHGPQAQSTSFVDLHLWHQGAALWQIVYPAGCSPIS